MTKGEIEGPDPVSAVCEHLAEEFGARFGQTTISVVAAEEIATFGEPPVRDFVPILAYRRARARLSDRACRWRHEADVGNGRAGECP